MPPPATVLLHSVSYKDKSYRVPCHLIWDCSQYQIIHLEVVCIGAMDRQIPPALRSYFLVLVIVAPAVHIRVTGTSEFPVDWSRGSWVLATDFLLPVESGRPKWKAWALFVMRGIWNRKGLSAVYLRTIYHFFTWASSLPPGWIVKANKVIALLSFLQRQHIHGLVCWTFQINTFAMFLLGFLWGKVYLTLWEESLVLSLDR